MKKRLDIWAMGAIIGLIAFGGFNMLGIRPDLMGNFLIFIVLGIVAFIVSYKTSISFLEQNYRALYVIFILLFIATFMFSDDIRGSRRWIDLYIFRFQTSEFFKPVFLITMASVLSSTNKFTVRKFSITVLLFLLPTLFIFFQPDLGSMLLYLATFLVMLYYSGLSSSIMLKSMSLGALLLPVGWLFLQEYQKARIIGFINPNLDPQGLTYNLNQSIITIGSGQLFGKGLGLGTQARHRFLPEFHTDFAFASLIEQFGFIGGLAVIALFAVLLVRLVIKLFNSRTNTFSYLFLIGSVTFLSLEIAVNIGMNLGLMPVTGIALPFISYGGSSILSTMILLGLALSL